MTGAEVRAAREALGMSCRQFAEALGLSGRWVDRTVRRWQVEGVNRRVEAQIKGLGGVE